MTHVSEIETATDWRNPLAITENRAFSEQTSWMKPVVEEEARFLHHLNNPVTFRFQYNTMESRQAGLEDATFAGIARWGSLFGLLDMRETPKPAAIHVAMPSDNWSWCADPALTPIIRLKKRLAILKVFDG
jgi:hypothetical protein